MYVCGGGAGERAQRVGANTFLAVRPEDVRVVGLSRDFGDGIRLVC